MAYFLPSFFQKRLLRYALSRLELVDTEALDLDSLGIRLGQRSTFELRDVGLRLAKLSTILRLPATCELLKARLSLLRVTIPADIYNSSIVVEAEGIHVHLKLLPDEALKEPQDDQQLKNVSNAAKEDKECTSSLHDLGGDRILPTTADLAQSFLEAEPKEEKEELKAAISSQSQYLQQSSTSLSDEEEELGLGNEGVSLPGFIAAFLKGVADRLQIKVKDITMRIDMDLRQDGPVKRFPAERPDPVTALLTVQELSVDRVTHHGDGDSPTLRVGRQVSLFAIHAMLVSEPIVFANYARFAIPQDSPSTNSVASRVSSRASSPSRPPAPLSSGSVPDMTRSVILDRSQLSENLAMSNPRSLENSVWTTGGKFSDAGTEAEYGSEGYPEQRPLSRSQYDDGVLDDPAYLDEALRAQVIDEIEQSTSFSEKDLASIDEDTQYSQSSQVNVAEAIEIFSNTKSKSCLDVAGDSSRPEGLISEIDSETVHDQVYSSHTEGKHLSPDSYNEGLKARLISEPSSTSSCLPTEDLSESKVFTHEEAESMYMSAMSHTSRNYSIDNIPGGWGSPNSRSSRDTTTPEQFVPAELATALANPVSKSVSETNVSTPKLGSQSKIIITGEQGSKNSRPSLGGPRSPNDPSEFTEERHDFFSPFHQVTEVARKVLEVDKVSIWLPSDDHTDDATGHASHDMKASTASLSESVADDESIAPAIDLPGQFRRDLVESLTPAGGAESRPQTPIDTHPSDGRPHATKCIIAVDVGSIAIQFDIATGWLLAKAGQKSLEAYRGHTDNASTIDASKDSSRSVIGLAFTIENCSINLFEYLTGLTIHGQNMELSPPPLSLSSADSIILRVVISGLRSHLSSQKDITKFHLGLSGLVFGSPTGDLITFDENLKMRESTRDILSPLHGDLSLSITRSKDSARANLTTLPVHLNFNIQQLEETLSWFGGLSMILELGNSVASVPMVHGATAKPQRGVHFETNIPPSRAVPAAKDVQWKINCRIGGIVADLVGENHMLKLKTTAVKVVGRFEGIGLQIDKAKLIGPFTSNDTIDKPAKINLNNIRVEYLFSPAEMDLDRLLSLITPSKDRYEDDDDIMLDTLFRQRKQGAVLRATVAKGKLAISHIDTLHSLSHLINELGKLSNVAKYLPEDNRPGILTLALVREMEGQIHIGGKIGDLRLLSSNMEMAHVSIPSLVAAQVGTIAITRNNEEELIGEVLPPTQTQNSARLPLPMIMARFIADELDPTIKVKLFNLRVEYTVPLIVALLEFGDDRTAEDVATNMANSIVNLVDLCASQQIKSYPRMPPADSSTSPETVDFVVSKFTVALRDCVLSLNPRDIPAKALVMLTHARLTTKIRKDETSEATFDLKKATLMIIDDAQHVGSVDNLHRHSAVSIQSDQVHAFVGMGYVPVCFISSAKVMLNVAQTDENGNKPIDVEIRDDLLILETCADSTQTLATIFNALTPPTPPSTAVKYRTEIMPIEDMLASFSGDAFATDDLFNPPSPSEPSQANPLQDPDNNIEAELEYVSDFYPTKPEYDPDVPTTNFTLAAREGDLLDSFHSEYHVSSSVSDLEFRDDHFTKKSAVGGTAHRWDSTHNTYGLANDVKLRGSPLRVRARDIHFIWNLYDGYDWQRTRDTISKAVKNVEARALDRRARAANRASSVIEEEESVIGDFLFNSIYIGIPATKDPRDLSHEISHHIDDLASETGSYTTSTTFTAITSRQGQSPSVRSKKLRLARSKHHKMAFELKGISADFVVFPLGAGETQSSLDIRVNNLEIFDHIPTSTWKKFATYMNDAGERESGTSMIHLELLNVKPVADLAASEMVLKATILPLRLHVDQDALDFMSRFFEFKDDSAPIPTSPGEAPFLQRAEVNAVRVRLDFKPKRVDYAGLRSGRTTEFMNFFVLDEADMILRHVIIYGISGFDKLGQTLNDIWMPDIKRNQLPGVLAGLAPIRSLVNVGSGVKDLVVIPMREYKKNGRVVRSIQKGAFAFAKTTTSELVKLGAKLAIGTQTVLQGAEEFLNVPTGQPTSHHFAADGRSEDDSADEDEKKHISLYADQPVGVVQGLRGAFHSLERDLLMARDAIVAVPGEVLESGSAAAAAKAVLRRAPTVILRPAIGASKAVGQTLLGAGNMLDPKNIRRVEDKYKRH